MNKITITIALFFLSLCCFSQKIEDINKVYEPKKFIQQKTKSPVNINQNDFVFNFCETDDNGTEEIDLIPIIDNCLNT